MNQMLRHNVFVAYERFVAGKICQIVLSGNYSPSNIERSKESVIRVKDTIRKVFEDRIKAHTEGAKRYERRIAEYRQGCDIGYWTVDRLEDVLSRQRLTIADFEDRLNSLLEAKLESFSFISQLANRDEIDVYLINGSIVINEKDGKAPPDA